MGRGKRAREAVERFADRPPGALWVGPATPAWAEVDREKIRTVLSNLLENAIKYSLADSRPVEVDLRMEGEEIVLTVQDDGPGIPEEDLSQLFEPFYRVDRSRSKKTGGYGLGLSLCKRIVEAHGGRIEARNRPGAAGRGAEVRVSLPTKC